MSKILRLLTVSLLLAGIMIATVAGPVFAAPGDGGQKGDCLRAGPCDPIGDGPWWYTEG